MLFLSLESVFLFDWMCLDSKATSFDPCLIILSFPFQVRTPSSWSKSNSTLVLNDFVAISSSHDVIYSTKH